MSQAMELTCAPEDAVPTLLGEAATLGRAALFGMVAFSVPIDSKGSSLVFGPVVGNTLGETVNIALE